MKKAVTKTGTKSATKATTKPKAKPKKKTKTAEEIAKKKERDAAKKEKELAKKAEQKVKDKQRKEKEKAKAVKTKEKEAKASERALFKSLPSLPPLSPPSAYALYFKEFFGQNRDKYSNPDGKVLVQDVTRGAAKEWSNLPQSEVERFQQQAKAARAAWESEYSEFYESLTPEIIKALEKKTGKKISPPGGVAKAKLELKNRPGNPGRPASSFFEYVKSIRSELEQDPRVSELHEPLQRTRQVAIIAGERWKTLSQEEKDVSYPSRGLVQTLSTDLTGMERIMEEGQSTLRGVARYPAKVIDITMGMQDIPLWRYRRAPIGS